jgi:hypothetical protein
MLDQELKIRFAQITVQRRRSFDDSPIAAQ